jgi:AraC-like DNA-binding protein
MELLKNTEKRVIDICYEAGFNNVNHFNRTLRQLTSISPRGYRKTEDQ